MAHAPLVSGCSPIDLSDNETESSVSSKDASGHPESFIDTKDWGSRSVLLCQLSGISSDKGKQSHFAQSKGTNM